MNYKVPVILVIISALLYYFLSPTPPLSDEQLTAQLNDKVVLICGASSGIGEELAYQLAAHGAKLALVARSQDKLDKVKAELLRRGLSEENVLIIPYDFSEVAGSKDVVEKTVEQFGVLDYLVSNHAAIIARPFLSQSYLQDPAYIEKIFRVNLFSHIQLAVHALPHLEKQKGHMYFTSSILGEVPLYQYGIYCSTKSAMNGFFYSLQQELLARESPVSLTIGALGLVWTKEISQLKSLNGADQLPGWATGKLEDCSRGIMEAYVTRPQTMTYPRFAGNLFRATWYFKPNFNEGMVQQLKPEGSEGTGYKEIVERRTSSSLSELHKKMGYQQGYEGN